MKQFSNRYIFMFATIMVAIVAFVLSSAAMFLQPKQERNAEIEKKRNILASVGVMATKNDAEELFDKYVTTSFVLNSSSELLEDVKAFDVEMKKEQRKPLEEQFLPVFMATMDDGTTGFIIPLEGKGLWGPIYGYISLKDDLATVNGATFDHKSETPGLGAEINETWFEDQFKDKLIFDGNNFTGIIVRKGGADTGDTHAVDAISGGTITSKALEKMIYDCLIKYVDYLKNNSK
ncbi:MAG TPA: NADH:ubiquinone reductase (Na(+)-transporting) subunit C [Bacteroidales bacterium]|nr:NADH:ubiquinone reductase (Na(+)-transporting) subunit C [Bacteroidales bacterium]